MHWINALTMIVQIMSGWAIRAIRRDALEACVLIAMLLCLALQPPACKPLGALDRN